MLLWILDNIVLELKCVEIINSATEYCQVTILFELSGYLSGFQRKKVHVVMSYT